MIATKVRLGSLSRSSTNSNPKKKKSRLVSCFRSVINNKDNNYCDFVQKDDVVAVAVAVEDVAVEAVAVAVAVFALSLLFVQLGLLRLECAPSDVPCRVALLYSPFFSPSILHHSLNRLNSGRSRRVPQERGIAQHVLVPRSLKDADASTPQ